MSPHSRYSLADHNCRQFISFRVLFNSRFYYPVLAILFLDLGLSAAQYTLLNVVWAIVIVLAEVPSGALADRIGRRPLVVAAAALMVAEMLVLTVAPRDGGMLLVFLCLINRILSGLAEAMASGADESLAYDALVAEGRAGEWPTVLARLMQWQSAGMVIAMLVGSAVYDPLLLNRLAADAGFILQLDQGTTLRFPIYLNLLAALCVLAISLRLRETPTPHGKTAAGARQALVSIVEAGRWITHSPTALFVIIGGLLIDSVIRVFLTFGSAYYRLIDLPEASYGLIGAAIAGIGLVVSPLARRLVTSGPVLRTYAALSALALFGLLGVALKIPLWGVAFAIPLGAAIATVGFAVSHHLNKTVDPAHRATVLSFKGLAFNLGYGFVSLLFAIALRAWRDSQHAADGFAEALALLPVWLGVVALLTAMAFWRHRTTLGSLNRQIQAPGDRTT